MYKRQVFESVNSDYADDIAMQIMTGELFNVECPHCKFVSHLEYDLLYHDMRHGAMVWVINPKSPDYMKKLTEVRTMQKLQMCIRDRFIAALFIIREVKRRKRRKARERARQRTYQDSDRQ